jgi:hypothetical protein
VSGSFAWATARSTPISAGALGEPVKALAVGDVEDERLHGDTVPRLRGQLACGVQDGCLVPVDEQDVIGDGE